MHAALRVVADEGLDARWARHERVANFLWQELERVGLACLIERENRLPSLTSVKVPDGIDAKKVTAFVLERVCFFFQRFIIKVQYGDWKRIGKFGWKSLAYWFDGHQLDGRECL